MVARLDNREFGKKSCTPCVLVWARPKIDILFEG